MGSHLEAVAYDAREPSRLGRFWADVLDRDLVDEGDAVLVPGTGGQLGLRFVRSDAPKPGQHPMHLHVTSEGEDQQRVVQSLLARGATHLDVGQLPEESHVVLADPEGYELCVIEPGNGFLRGCGPLGELTCDGTHAVGLFWSQVLGWPLVWDEGEETAVQSPQGGTKVSWGGGPGPDGGGTVRQQFHLVTDDVAAEVARLVSLGATAPFDSDGDAGGRTDRGVTLRDPDGMPFLLRARA